MGETFRIAAFTNQLHNGRNHGSEDNWKRGLIYPGCLVSELRWSHISNCQLSKGASYLELCSRGQRLGRSEPHTSFNLTCNETTLCISW